MRFHNGSCCILSAKQAFAVVMSVKSHYTRFLFFFIVYLGVNLLIIKIKSSDYIYDNVLSILRRHKSVLPRNGLDNFSHVMKRKENISISILTKTIKVIPLEPKDHQKTMKQIFDTCEENNLTTSVIKRNFLYSFQYGGLYCWIRKAGSTSFTKIFSDMNNRMVARNYYKEVEFLAPKTEDSLKNLTKDPRVFKLLVVRHPFERLVSAFRDRIEDNSRYTAQSWIYVPKIFHVTRPELFDSSGAIDESLFKIFYEDKRLKLIPTFKEFVKWLLQQDSDKDDPHWNQYYKHCGLCSITYDYVLKLDNYTSNDINYIFARMNLNRNNDYLPKLEQTKAGCTDFEETCNYFKNLSHAAVVNLYEKYRIDFDMFNYEFDKYFECTDGD